MSRIRVACVVCVLAVLVLVGQALAGGRDDTYIGPVNQAPADQFSPNPTIDLYVHTQHHHNGKVVTKVTQIVVFDMSYLCADGNIWVPGPTGGSRSKLTLTGKIILKGRSFSRTEIDESAGTSVALTGKIPKHGQATGTIRLTDNLDPPLGHCDSGSQTWSASRQ